jgi:hypothetical protein
MISIAQWIEKTALAVCASAVFLMMVIGALDIVMGNTIGTFLCDAEDRAPTVHDVTDDVWKDLFDAACAEDGWTAWHDFVSASRLIVRLLQEAGVP